MFSMGSFPDGWFNEFVKHSIKMWRTQSDRANTWILTFLRRLAKVSQPFAGVNQNGLAFSSVAPVSSHVEASYDSIYFDICKSCCERQIDRLHRSKWLEAEQKTIDMWTNNFTAAPNKDRTKKKKRLKWVAYNAFKPENIPRYLIFGVRQWCR